MQNKVVIQVNELPSPAQKHQCFGGLMKYCGCMFFVQIKKKEREKEERKFYIYIISLERNGSSGPHERDIHLEPRGV